MADEAQLREYLKRATADLRTTRRRLRAAEAREHEALAIVGMGCRYPGGVRSPRELWELLAGAADAIAPVPIDRGWDLRALADLESDRGGSGYACEGGFIDGVGDFDAAFFGINPREALAMDPQQRLLLETGWEALEDGGIDPASLRGTRTGVFAGVANSAYAESPRRPPPELQGYLLTGGASSVASGRLAYVLGLEGPAVSIDTACSSSLVALHLACQALRRGECSLALAGGVSVIAGPGLFVEVGQLRGLAPDGRCKAFAEAADGTGWGEGVGVLVLERLEDARRNDHRVLAVVRGSAVNQDGASNGLTAPNGPAQERVIHAALLDAQLAEADIDAVEAHGTGTALGDPIEAHALLATYGRERPAERPLWLGSIKSNIGHTQSAAGVAGVIKMVLALRHGVLPRTLHVDRPSTKVDWSAGTVSLLSEPVPWERGGEPRRAAVSSFGISGTNAHVILEEGPEPAARPSAEEHPMAEAPLGVLEGVAVPWLLSASGEPALRAQAARLLGFLEGAPRLSVADIGRSLLDRSALEQRGVVLGGGREELLTGLGALARGEPLAGVLEGRAEPSSGVVFVFPGQGSQWQGMAVELLDSAPVFAAALEECQGALSEHVDWSVEQVLRGVAGSPSLERIEVLQPALFAVMVSLARLWQECGVHPDAVVGHSQGEIAAAHVAGGLSLEDAARLVVLRSQMLAGMVGHGGVASIALGAREMRERLARWEGRLAVAGVNGPRAVAVAGDRDALSELLEECVAEGLRAREVPGTVASHSAAVEHLEEEVLRAFTSLAPRSGTIAFYSTVTAGPLDTAELDAGYWYRNLREAVEFQGTTQALLDDGHRTFIEISPHPVLTLGIHETAEDAVAIGSLRREEGGSRRFLTALGEAWAHGVDVDWVAVFAGSDARQVELPTYAFQRERYWLADGAGAALDAQDPGPEVESPFWEAVAAGDASGLAEVLDLPESDGKAALEQLLPALSGWWRGRREDSEVDGWRYRIAWKSVAAEGALPQGSWLLVVPADGAAGEWEAALIAALEAAGAGVERLEFDPGVRDAREWLARSLGEKAAPSGIVSLLALAEDGASTGGTPGSALASSLALAQALGDAGVAAPLWLATRGAVTVDSADRIEQPAAAMLWGLGVSLGLECPELLGGLVDLPPAPDERTVAQLCKALAGAGAEDQLAVRPAGLFARRLMRAPLGARASRSTWAPRGTVLVTGGTGGLGAHVARWLADTGVERLLLVGRRGSRAPGAGELRAELQARGAAVEIAACDVSDRAALQALLESIPDEHPLDAVVHAAGVSSFGALAQLTGAGLRETLAAKASGALHLHELTARSELSAFVLFSSMAAVLGSGSQADYAAANAFLDALAEHRRGLGLPATSIAWGMWAGEGMAALGAEGLRRRGIREMAPALALGALRRALERDETCAIVTDVEWERYAPSYAFARARPLIGDLPEVRRAFAQAPSDPSDTTAPGATSALAASLADLPERERERVTLELVCAGAAGVLGHASSAAVQPQRAFKELGFDSLTAVALRDRLQATTGLRLAATVVFDHPTPLALAAHLRSEALGERAEAGTPTAGAGRASMGEPVAIVGMSCRYPGDVHSPEDLWRLLDTGTDAISGFPEDRGWDLERLYDSDPERRGTSYARAGGFVGDVAEFDAAFFGIGPREALAMDPQQRLLLEGGWEALERAGIDPSSLRGSATGVFAGINPSTYGIVLPEELEGYRLTSGAGSVVSGRVAYALGLEGPAISVDTACSSSLVALHLACAALRAGECSLALAGGVATIADPTAFVAFSRQGGLARDGRCKSFADAADGTGWSEGMGVLALERLADAQRNGHPVLAVVRGSAVNQDGASNGLSAPNGPAQQRVILQALANAGLGAQQIDAVEAHGTGTRLGDPIEAQALLATYGRARPAERPLRLGSIKSNIGHPQAASGVAGVIKMTLALQHETLPKTLHVDSPSTQVDWSEDTVALLTEALPWPAGDEPRRAGISSFGVSGTNVHLILEQAPTAADGSGMADGSGAADGPVAPHERRPPGVTPWVLSAQGEQALAAQARRLLTLLEREPALAAVDVGLSLAASRAALVERAVVLGEDREGMLAGLRALAAGEAQPDVVRGAAYGARERLAYLFTGQGAQRAGMGSELYQEFPAFASALDEVLDSFEDELAQPLREALLGAEDGAALERTLFAQTGLFALEVALFRLLETWGMSPDYLVGHSVGELAAAHVAGVLSLADACMLVAARGRLMGELPAGGAMVAVQASEAELRETLAGLEGLVALAAVNGPAAVVCSGEEDAVLELADAWRARGRKTRRLQVSHAFHSPRMDAMLGELAAVAERLTFSAPRIPIVSNLTGEPVSAEEIRDPGYWARHAREPVRFDDAIAWLHGQRVSSFLELGPEGVLSAMVQESLAGTDATGDRASAEHGATSRREVVASALLRGGRGEVRTLLGALAQMWTRGVELDWRAAFADSGARVVELPTYAFQRRRYWLDPPAARGAEAAGARSDGAAHPLLDGALALADGLGWLFSGRLSVATQPWLADHVVMGKVLVPGTTFVELALRAGRELGCEVLEELVMEAPLVLSAEGAARLQIAVGEPDESGRRQIAVHSCPELAPGARTHEPAPWTRHAGGVLTAGERDAPKVPEEWPPSQAEPLEVASMYGRLAELGVEYGPAFTGVRALWRAGEDVLAEVRLPEAQWTRARAFGVHPALLDAALQTVAAYAPAEAATLAIPFAWSGVSVHALGAKALRVRVSPAPAGGFSLLASDEHGAPVVSIDSLVIRAVSAEQLERTEAGARELLFALEWEPLPAGGEAPAEWAPVVVGADDAPLASALREAGAHPEVYPDLAALGAAVASGRTACEVALLDCAEATEDAGESENAWESENAGELGMAAAVHAATNRALESARAWLADERLAACRLALVTRGAVAARTGEDLPGLAQAGIWGLLRAAQAESPGRFALIDLDGERASLRTLASALAATRTAGESQLALRAGELLAPRLAPLAAASSASGEPQAFEPEGTVLLTGGTGGIGALLARHLVAGHGVRHLLLAGRRGAAAPGADELEAELVELGASVRIVACDVGDREQLQALLASIAPEHPLRAVIHAAGVLDDGVLGSLTEAKLGTVLAPKVAGAWHLHELTADMELSAFVLFSSLAGVLGGAGQGNYAAANAFLDALAAVRRAHGLAGRSIAWGPWAQTGGMADELAEVDRKRIARAGIASLSAAEGLGLFDAAQTFAQPLVVAAKLDRPVLRGYAEAGTLPAVLRGVIRAPLRGAADVERGVLARRLTGVSGEDRGRIVLELVRAHAAMVLGHPSPAAIEARQSFKELGFDSLAAVEFRNRLSAAAELNLPATLVFDYPTPAALVDHLQELLTVDGAAPAVSLDRELGELERRLAALAAGAEGRARLTDTLQRFLAGLRDPAGTAEDDEDVRSASAADVFELIDRELERR